MIEYFYTLFRRPIIGLTVIAIAAAVAFYLYDSVEVSEAEITPLAVILGGFVLAAWKRLWVFEYRLVLSSIIVVVGVAMWFGVI